ncbi:MAG: hypothetical protein RJA35_17 [Actinomycetota bacterium]|jgi:aminoglycoside phosphotransferase (APT) family kinase protein
MAKSPLILAALAKDAVPQLNFVQAMPLSLGHAGQYDAAVLTSTDGTHYVVRQANSEAAALELDTELVVLRALTPFRSHFPFEITKLIGETKDDRGKRVQVFSYVYGEPLALLNQPATSPLASSLANTFAAIHSLPLSVVENNGLPTFTPENIIRERVAELDRAAQTGRISGVLLNRWERALEDVNIWRFQPTVVHGDARLNNYLMLDGGVSGVLGWHNLQIGDPAEDFSFVQANASEDFAYSTLLEYEQLRGADQNFRARAMLYAELEVARYLLWGLANQSDEVITDAENWLHELLSDVETGVTGPIGAKPLGTDAVLSNVPETEFLGSPMDFAAGFVDEAQAVVADDQLLVPVVSEAWGQDEDSESAEIFKPIIDDSYNHKDLFGETAPIPVVADVYDATTEIPVYSDDATAPITLPTFESEAEDAEGEDAEPKGGAKTDSEGAPELF